MKRRRFVLGCAAAGLTAGGVAAWKFWPEQGFSNPCKIPLPQHLAQHPLVQSAWESVDATKVWDSHAHLVGIGDSDSGIWLNPAMHSTTHPMQYAQRIFFMNAGCARDEPGKTDQSVVERLRNLIAGLRPGVKLVLLAFDHCYNEQGERLLEKSAFHIPNDYAMRIAKTYPSYFEWAASIHPYRQDSVDALAHATKNGARAVKWLPPAHGINPASELCDRFYAAMVKYNLPLITHAGQERAVHGANQQAWANPLLLRRALDHGVRVIVAHCASMGESHDLDQGKNGALVRNFDLFARMMAEQRYEGKLFGEISAMTQFNRAMWIPSLIEHQEWHHRLLNGSDYPLPGVMPLFSVSYYAQQGLIAADTVPVLKEIREYNPLLFDFVLKRQLRWKEKQLAKNIFETKTFFLN